MTAATKPLWSCYLELCKPRVVSLMILTAVIGMLLASDTIAWDILLWGNLGIALVAGAGAVLNHLIDQKIDVYMHRTKNRPIPSGRVTAQQALIFAIILAIAGLALLTFLVNGLCALLTAFTLLGYAIIYTVFLKHATPQNIVIGGLAGAMPPLLGWSAVTGTVDPKALLLVLIIYLWTPPHFWALAIYRLEDYRKANIPMLPVTHGVPFTKLNIVLYTCLLMAISLMPYIINMSGLIYLAGAIMLGSIFLFYAIKLKRSDDLAVAAKTFRYSIIYLMTLFMFLLIDHFIPLNL